MMRRGDRKLCLRPTGEKSAQNVIRIDKNTHLQEKYFLQDKIIIIRAGVTLSFKDVDCSNTKFIFQDDLASPDLPIGKVVFYGKISGQYSVCGEGTIVKYDLPEILGGDNGLVQDNIEDVPIIGES